MSDLSYAEDVQKKIEDAAKKEAADREYEQRISRELYDRDDVKAAGQIALSKVSALLIRYNRLKDVERQRDSLLKEAEQEALIRRESRIRAWNKDRQEAEAIPDPVLREKVLKELMGKSDEIQEDYEGDMKKAETEYAYSSYVPKALEANVNDDRSGAILSTAMLGGNAQGSKGYTLTTGDVGDITKASAYIQDMSGEKGNLFSQMSLLENAMTTGGVDMGKQNENENSLWVGSSVNGATYSVRDILGSVTQDEMETMNFVAGDDNQMELSIGELEAAKKNGELDDQLGKKKEKMSIDEAATLRGNGATKEEGYGLSEEAKQRQMGKIGGVNDLSGAEKKRLINAAKPQGRGFWASKFGERSSYRSAKPGGRGFLSSLFHGERSAYRLAKRGAERSALREARKAWEAQMRAIRNAPAKEMATNDEDTAATSLPPMPAATQASPASAAAPKGSGSNAVLSGKEQEALRQVQEGQPDKTAKNMIAAYRLMGASPEELYRFRLALIATMVPSGKKTLRQILEESREAGYVGNEDLSSSETMYRTFSIAPIVNGTFVNRYVKNGKTMEYGAIRDMQKVKKEKLVAALEGVEKSERDEATIEKEKKGTGSGTGTLSILKEQQDKKKAKINKWKDTVRGKITELSEEDEDNEDYEEAKVEEESPLARALSAHMKKVGADESKEDVLETFKEIFKNHMEGEIFGTLLSEAELAEIRSSILLNADFDREAIRIIAKKL